MKVTKEIIEKVVNDYGYTDWTKIVVRKDGEIILKFEYEQPQMDLIFAISAIVQDIFEESGINPEYADYVWLDFTRKYINIKFNNRVQYNLWN